MSSKPEELRERTKGFAIRIVRLFRSLPRTTEAQVMGKQLLRCGTAVAANYRAVCRARSKAEFLAKVGVVVEEADESVMPKQRLEGLLAEAHQLTAIFTASQRTARERAA